jgi:hypothetical protein
MWILQALALSTTEWDIHLAGVADGMKALAWVTIVREKSVALLLLPLLRHCSTR